jgi:mannose-1-phosphate guanylyltransferase
MIDWLRRHGVEHVILACGFMAESVRQVLGDGASLGVEIDYVEEPEPLGTGGALRYAGDRLQQRFLMLNGDVLSDLDLSAQLAQHERTGAIATLALYPVEDPSMYGLVRLGDDGSVREFVEKPNSEEFDSNLINAGAYVLEASLLDEMPPPGTNISIERDVFPQLVGRGLFGHVGEGYWLDIGTPDRYLQGTFDILEGNVATELAERLEDGRHVLADGASSEGRLIAPGLLGPGTSVARGAIVGGCVALGRDVVVEESAHVERSVVLDGARIGAHASIRSSILGPGAAVGAHCRLDGVVLGEGVTLGAGNILRAGARVSPGVSLPDAGIRF